MADKRGDFASRAIGGIAAAAAGFVTRKVMSRAWKRITGKEPPEHPEDPEVALGEAIGWAVTMGVAMATARLLATRLTAKRMQGPAAIEAGPAPAAKD
ncbi:MAG TPA: DUF4235 domain-containing protein [Streptosporangiaceae bacterium]|jgi:hypothetical protein|nr:DUF4235 domain-containing protein [Streptosporangiaceae bacterium]